MTVILVSPKQSRDTRWHSDESNRIYPRAGSRPRVLTPIAERHLLPGLVEALAR